MRYQRFPLDKILATSSVALLSVLSCGHAQSDVDLNVWFANDVDTTQIFFSDDPAFLVMVDADPGDTLKPDTLAVSLSTEQGDRETYLAVETGPASGQYVAAVAMKAIKSPPTPDNHLIELDGSVPETETVVLEAAVDLGDGPETASMDLGFPAGDAIAARGRGFLPGRLPDGIPYSVDGRMLRKGAAAPVRGMSVLRRP
jgi:hypothetical protein